jgi:hypothetical protein
MNTTNVKASGPPSMSAEEFARLGGGSIAYLRPIRSEQVGTLFPGAPEIQPGLNLFALLGADGSPIMLTDSKDAALANAIEQQLLTVSVH